VAGIAGIRITACMLAWPPFATLSIEDFDCYVTSAAAPIATGWSDSCRAGWIPLKTDAFHGVLREAG